MPTLAKGWHRERGRDDYDGWVLYLANDTMQLIVGHPWWKCALYYAMCRIGLIKTLPRLGRIEFVRMCRRARALKLAEAVS